MSIQKSVALALVASLVLVALPVSAETGGVATVVVTPATASINLRQSVDFDVQAFDADGNEVAVTNVTWSSTQDTDSRTTVNADGVFKPAKAGTVVVTANVSGVLGTATVVVSDKLVVDVELSGETFAVLGDVRGTVDVAFQDGTSPGVSGVNVYFAQLGPGGVVLRATYVTTATDANGFATFEAPRGWNVPGDYRVTVSVYDGANSGTDADTYSVAL